MDVLAENTHKLLEVYLAAAKAGLVTVPLNVRLAPEELSSGVSGLELDAARRVVVYCTEPNEAISARESRELRKLGFKDVRILKGGLGAWTNAGLPIETRSDISAVGLEIYKALAGGTA